MRCNMEIEGGGWLVFFRRTNESLTDFNRKWSFYKSGFGDIHNEFWLGNEFIHEMSSSKEHQVLVWSLKTDGVTKIFSMHDSFKIGNETDLYRIYYNETSRKGEESFIKSNVPFTTLDKDNDDAHHLNCASHFGGGFWYNGCGANFLQPSDKMIEIMIRAMY